MQNLKIVRKTKIVKDEKGKEKELTFNNIYLFGICIKALNPNDTMKLYYLVKGALANENSEE